MKLVSMRTWLAAGLLAVTALPARPADVVLGMSLPLSGPVALTGKSALGGIEAYLAHVNRDGGIAGRKVILQPVDDAYQVDRLVENFGKLLAIDQVEAIIFAAGTTAIEKALPILDQSKKPLIGGLTGASSLRTDKRSNIYHVRASYADEVHRLVKQVTTVSQSRVYAVWQEDGLGRDALNALRQSLANSTAKLVGSQSMTLSSNNEAAIAQEILQSGADALMLFCTTPCAGKVLSKLPKETRLRITPYALSVVDGERLAKGFGDATHGTVISQVMPNPHQPTTELVRRYQSDIQQLTGKADYGYLSLEAYVTAIVAVEAAKVVAASGGKISMDAAMKRMTRREFFGIPVSAGGLAGVRPHPVTLSMIDKRGKLIH